MHGHVGRAGCWEQRCDDHPSLCFRFLWVHQCHHLVTWYNSVFLLRNYCNVFHSNGAILLKIIKKKKFLVAFPLAAVSGSFSGLRLIAHPGPLPHLGR